MELCRPMDMRNNSSPQVLPSVACLVEVTRIIANQCSPQTYLDGSEGYCGW